MRRTGRDSVYMSIEDVDASMLRAAVDKSRTRADVLDTLGFVSNGGMYKRLNARADYLGIDLPARQRRAATQDTMATRVGKSEIEFIPAPPTTLNSVLPPGQFVDEVTTPGVPSRGLDLISAYDKEGQTGGKTIKTDVPAKFDFPGSQEVFNEPQREGYDKVAKSDRLIEGNPLMPEYQSIIDKLEEEISEFQDEIDKRRAAQDALRVLGE